MNAINPRHVSLNNPFIALRHKNFRYYSIGMIISLIGTWMQNIAQPWLAYELTKSPFLLSLIGALQFTPVLLFSLVAGVIIDKYPKKKIIVLTQSASLLITLILALLVWTGHVRYWHILLMATALGCANTFDMPARQAFVIELVGKDDLMNAIALNSTIFNLSRVVGPALAGVIMATAGMASCFFINAFSFAAVLISLIFIKPLVQPAKQMARKRIRADVAEGLRYVFKNPILFETILAIAIVGTFAPNFSVLVPVFTNKILHLQEKGFGFLMSFLGIGSLLGAIFIASTSKSGPKRYLRTIIPFVIGLFLMSTGYMNNFVLTALLLALTGFFFVAFSSNANSTLQLNSDQLYRGRVMSIYALVFSGSTPIGNLYAGIISDRIDARMGFVACGAAILILMGLLLSYKKLLPGYWPMKRRQIGLAILVILLSLTGIGLVLILWLDRSIIKAGRRRIIDPDHMDLLEPCDCVIVPGALVYPNGMPGQMLKDRLDMALKIYQSGITNRILISGDNGQDSYDEVIVMRNYLLDRGVIPEHIFMDHAGFDTYETIYRAKSIFAVQKAVITTQRFHLLRALYIGEKLGINLLGMPSDMRKYRKMTLYRIREYFARFKAFLDCVIFHPEAMHLGKVTPISGNGLETINRDF